jgi:hypothetical protein
MYRLEQYNTSEFVIWENHNYLGSMSLASNGLYEYVDKLGRTIRLNDPLTILKVLDRKSRDSKELRG